MSARIEHGDLLRVIPRLVAEGMLVDSIVTDPPYGLGFMGKDWDHGVPGVVYWKAVASILKPGGYLLAFGGARTYHRMVCAVEDAGFVIQDCIMWLHGMGFPKGRTMLKPAHEPIVVAYKPGGPRSLQIDECRVPASEVPIERSGEDSQDRRYTEAGGTDFAAKPGARRGRPLRVGDYKETDNSVYAGRVNGDESFRDGSKAVGETDLGRWPANVCHDGSDDVMAAFGVFGDKTSGTGAFVKDSARGYKPNAYGTESREAGTPMISYGDTGSASRFFYCTKARGEDRGGSKHPTIKPLSLMRWLVPLVTPPGGLTLDPFAGTGTTGAAAIETGRKAILIECEPEYVADIRTRLARYDGSGGHSLVSKNRNAPEKTGTLL